MEEEYVKTNKVENISIPTNNTSWYHSSRDSNAFTLSEQSIVNISKLGHPMYISLCRTFLVMQSQMQDGNRKVVSWQCGTQIKTEIPKTIWHGQLSPFETSRSAATQEVHSFNRAFDQIGRKACLLYSEASMLQSLALASMLLTSHRFTLVFQHMQYLWYTCAGFFLSVAKTMIVFSSKWKHHNLCT